MPIIPISVQVLEMNKRKAKKTDVVFNNLICFQAGQEYPELITVDVPDSKVDEATDLCGEEKTLMVDFVHNKFGARYKFIRVA